jgi:mRNA interferase MazF
VVVSPDDLNTHLRTVMIAPMTTAAHRYPFRVPSRFSGKNGEVDTDQLRTVDRERLVRHLGRLSAAIMNHLLDVLQEMFTP